MGKEMELARIRNSVAGRLGHKVLVKLNKGRHRVDIRKGVIKEAYPSIFIIEFEDKLSEEAPSTLSFSYTDVITKDVCMKLC